MSTEAQVKNFFISKENYVSFSRYSSFDIFNHPMIYQICNVMMSISIYMRQGNLLNHYPLSQRAWPIHRYKHGQQFSGIFWIIWRIGAKFQILLNLATWSNYSITNYVKNPVFYFFEKMNKRQSKMLNINN